MRGAWVSLGPPCPHLMALTRLWGLRCTPSSVPLRNSMAEPAACSSLPVREAMGSVPSMKHVSAMGISSWSEAE